MSSIRQVAKQAGVSIATVSRVMNGGASVRPELRDRVLEVAGACDYTPSTGKRHAERIALIYMGEFWLDSPYDSACVEGLGRAMRRSQYDLTLCDLQRDRLEGESIKQFFARKGIRGAVIRSSMEYRGQLRAMSQERLPLVALGDHFPCEGLRFAYACSREASREAVEHLVSLGHQRIAFVACDRDDGDHTDRMEAYQSVMEAAGLFRQRDIHRVPPGRMDGAPLARRILSKADRPTAMFIADPLVAVGVINEAHKMGVRVPEDLSIVGFDDSDTRNTVYPRMCAVCQDAAAVGEMAFDLVREMIEGAPNASSSLPSQTAWFEINDSTAPPPADVKAFLPKPRALATPL